MPGAGAREAGRPVAEAGRREPAGGRRRTMCFAGGGIALKHAGGSGTAPRRVKTPGLIDIGSTNEHRGRDGAIAAHAIGFARS